MNSPAQQLPYVLPNPHTSESYCFPNTSQVQAMVADSTSRDFTFIVATDEKKPDGKTRKLIRREVMKGKNKGRTLPPRRLTKETTILREEHDHGDESESPDSTSTSTTISLPELPARVGSDLSFFLVAGERIDPSVLKPIVRFAIEAKPAMFVLQAYFDFPRHPAQWSQSLNSDPAYLNAVLSASHAYFDYLSGLEVTTVHRRRHAYTALSRCLTILRERISNEHDTLRLADTTVMAILCLASYSNRVRQDETSAFHLKGLRHLIGLRGGLKTLRKNPKLLIETFRSAKMHPYNEDNQN